MSTDFSTKLTSAVVCNFTLNSTFIQQILFFNVLIHLIVEQCFTLNARPLIVQPRYCLDVRANMCVQLMSYIVSSDHRIA